MKPEFISVIIPVFHDWHRLKLCLERLAAQMYPADNFEVVVVNNDPTDPCPFVLPAPNMRIVEEHVKSSYAARNAGIRASRNAGTHVARAGILAFTDSDCLPDKQWLEKGVRCLQEDQVMLAGGQIRFLVDHPVSASALLDAASHMDNEDTIAKHHCAVTANLFVRSEVFDAVGPFDGSMMSGGDIAFTQRASSHGFILAYCPEALVWHPTRDFSQKIRKAFRVGRGLPKVEFKRPAHPWKKARMLLLHLLPLTHPRRIRRAMKRYSVKQNGLFVRALFLSVALGLVKSAGMLYSLPAAMFCLKKSANTTP